jgi:hypothetical protein
MFDPDTWGTVAAWTGSLLTGLSVLFGVGYYVFDRRRERRAQAGSVVALSLPTLAGRVLPLGACVCCGLAGGAVCVDGALQATGGFGWWANDRTTQAEAVGVEAVLVLTAPNAVGTRTRERFARRPLFSLLIPEGRVVALFSDSPESRANCIVRMIEAEQIA